MFKNYLKEGSLSLAVVIMLDIILAAILLTAYGRFQGKINTEVYYPWELVHTLGIRGGFVTLESGGALYIGPCKHISPNKTVYVVHYSDTIDILFGVIPDNHQYDSISCWNVYGLGGKGQVYDLVKEMHQRGSGIFGWGDNVRLILWR